MKFYDIFPESEEQLLEEMDDRLKKDKKKVIQSKVCSKNFGPMKSFQNIVMYFLETSWCTKNKKIET